MTAHRGWGRDVLDSGVDLTAGGQSVNVEMALSANGGSIEGSVEDGAGAEIILVPADAISLRSRVLLYPLMIR